MVNLFDWTKKGEPLQKWILIGFLCLLWYVVSLGKGLLAKFVLTQFGHPLTLTFVQLVSISVYIVPVLFVSKLKFLCVSKRYLFRYVLPLAILKVLTTAAGHLAIWKVSVSYSQTIRATMPIFTVILCRLLLGTRETGRVYLSLVPIVVGVAVATFTESAFNLFGMLCGIAATAGQSIQVIYNKELMDLSQIHSFQLTAIMGWLSCVLFFPFWFGVDGQKILYLDHQTLSCTSDWLRILCLLILDGFVNFLQNVLAFGVLFLITPTSYAVANVSKRPFVIGLSIYVFKNNVTLLNGLGMMVTIIGGGLYTFFRMADEKNCYDISQTREKSSANQLDGETNKENEKSNDATMTEKWMVPI